MVQTFSRQKTVEVYQLDQDCPRGIPFKNSVDVQFSYVFLVGQILGASDSDGKEII